MPVVGVLVKAASQTKDIRTNNSSTVCGAKAAEMSADRTHEAICTHAEDKAQRALYCAVESCGLDEHVCEKRPVVWRAGRLPDPHQV